MFLPLCCWQVVGQLLPTLGVNMQQEDDHSVLELGLEVQFASLWQLHALNV